MLLPSALPCDSLRQSQHPASATTAPPSPGGPFSLSSCRALQAILGSRPASPFQLTLSTAAPAKTTAPIVVPRHPQPTRPPLRSLPHIVNTIGRAPVPQQPPQQSPVVARKSKKRSRADFEAQDGKSVGATWQGDPDCLPISTFSPRRFHNPTACMSGRETYSTPKRRRRVPVLMPLGLSAEDFEGLEATPRARPGGPPSNIGEGLDMPAQSSTPSETAARPEWSTADDRALVSTVLNKLNLSRKDWNECRGTMAKDADSLGKRWKILARDRDVGLRRGSGGRKRPEVSGEWMRRS
jgi:hypothetical protein